MREMGREVNPVALEIVRKTTPDEIAFDLLRSSGLMEEFMRVDGTKWIRSKFKVNPHE